MNKQALRVEGQNWLLNESRVMYQELTMAGDEQAAMEQLLILNKWHSEAEFTKGYNEDQFRELDMLLDQSAIMWTKINGVRWFKLTQLGHELKKALTKKIGIVARVKIKLGGKI